MRPGLGLLAAAVALVLPTLAWGAYERPCDRDAPRDVAIFYYAWYGTPAKDGAWVHWNQTGVRPPTEIGSTFFPARGPYSSSDAVVLESHMREIAAADVTTIVVSWWGQGSVEDQRLPAVAAAAARHGLRVAVHVEPYPGRSSITLPLDFERFRSFGIRDVYVYDSTALPDSEWLALNLQARNLRLLANTRLPGKAAAGGFAGLYTYDVLLYDGDLFGRMCAQARTLGLVCAPSVGPGYDARNATPDRRVRPRQRGRTYDQMWRGAIRAKADIVTITSYNEWHEGTQIEPARPAGPRYQTYDGAWGLNGAAAQGAYVDRTAHWASRFRGGPHGVILP